MRPMNRVLGKGTDLSVPYWQLMYFFNASGGFFRGFQPRKKPEKGAELLLTARINARPSLKLEKQVIESRRDANLFIGSEGGFPRVSRDPPIAMFAIGGTGAGDRRRNILCFGFRTHQLWLRFKSSLLRAPCKPVPQKREQVNYPSAAYFGNMQASETSPLASPRVAIANDPPFARLTLSHGK